MAFVLTTELRLVGREGRLGAVEVADVAVAGLPAEEEAVVIAVEATELPAMGAVDNAFPMKGNNQLLDCRSTETEARIRESIHRSVQIYRRFGKTLDLPPVAPALSHGFGGDADAIGFTNLASGQRRWRRENWGWSDDGEGKGKGQGRMWPGVEKPRMSGFAEIAVLQTT